MPSELGIAPGGLIKQHIRKDTRDPKGWVKGLAIPFRVQILDTSTFRQVTGEEPPACPIDAETVSLPEKFTNSSIFVHRSCTICSPLFIEPSLVSLGSDDPESPVSYPYIKRKRADLNFPVCQSRPPFLRLVRGKFY